MVVELLVVVRYRVSAAAVEDPNGRFVVGAEVVDHVLRKVRIDATRYRIRAKTSHSGIGGGEIGLHWTKQVLCRLGGSSHGDRWTTSGEDGEVDAANVSAEWCRHGSSLAAYVFIGPFELCVGGALCTSLPTPLPRYDS